MTAIQYREYRCVCGRLLFLGETVLAPLQVKCKRCKQVSTFGVEVEVPAPFLRMFANATHVPVLVADDRATIVHVNPAWEGVFQYQLIEVQGRPLAFVHTTAASAQPVASGERFLARNDVVGTRKDGMSIRMAAAQCPIPHQSRWWYVHLYDAPPRRDEHSIIS